MREFQCKRTQVCPFSQWIAKPSALPHEFEFQQIGSLSRFGYVVQVLRLLILHGTVGNDEVVAHFSNLLINFGGSAFLFDRGRIDFDFGVPRIVP